MIVKGYIFSILYALLCLGLAFVLYKLGIQKKTTRKVVHILVGFEWFILYHYMGPSWHFLVVCLLFLLILFIAYRKNLMPMISSDGDNAPGTVYYAVAMSVMGILILFIPKMILPFGIGVFCTSFGDGFAGMIGQSVNSCWNIKIWGKKSILGSTVNLLICFGVAMFFSHYFNMSLSVWQCFIIALLAFELELFAGRGLDNILITLGTSLLAYFFAFYESAESYIIPILLTPAIIAFAIKKKALTFDGILAAIALDLVVSISLGNFGFSLLFAFFALGIVSDKIKKRYNKTVQSVEKRGSCRNYVQVISNGFAPAICTILFAISNEKVFIFAFVATLAEALADTVASGIGAISGKVYDICRLKPCTPGISGGVSFIGTLFSLIGSFTISLLAFVFGAVNILQALIITLCGFLGALFDSVLGSLLQVKYKCSVCNGITEMVEHCGKPTVKQSGFVLINNDVVNLLGTLSAGLMAYLVFILH